LADPAPAPGSSLLRTRWWLREWLRQQRRQRPKWLHHRVARIWCGLGAAELPSRAAARI
jgi:hypothetical protein